MTYGATTANTFMIHKQLGNVKEARGLATEITERGARLYDLLGKEKDARPQRLRAVAFLEVRGCLKPFQYWRKMARIVFKPIRLLCLLQEAYVMENRRQTK